MKFIKQWLANRAIRLAEENIAKGFGWAMNQYYRKGVSIDTLENYIKESLTFNDYSCFDVGIEEALGTIESQHTSSGT